MELARILYIDDEDANLFSFNEIFKDEFEIFISHNTEQAFEIVRTHNIHIIISDQRMPKETGVEFFEKIIDKYPNIIRILMTGYTDSNVLINAINKVKIHKYISKPWNEFEIRTILREAYLDYKRNPEVNTNIVGELVTLKEKLSNILSGRDQQNEFHDVIFQTLKIIFHPNLIRGKKELKINNGRKRVDIFFENNNTDGFFGDLIRKHKIKSPYIHIECKNYKDDLNNPDLDQICGRFNNERGKFGMIFCRKIYNNEKMIAGCRDIIKDKRGYVMVFEDSDLLTLLELKLGGRSIQIQDFLKAKFEEIIL